MCPSYRNQSVDLLIVKRLICFVFWHKKIKRKCISGSNMFNFTGLYCRNVTQIAKSSILQVSITKCSILQDSIAKIKIERYDLTKVEQNIPRAKYFTARKKFVAYL